jgi:hypothetical protein
VLDGGEHASTLVQVGATEQAHVMRDSNLLQLALAWVPPWMAPRSEFDPEAHRLDIHTDFPLVAAFPARTAAPRTAQPTTASR